ncbi:T9SS type B sorting domain-containing protein [Flavobacterium sp. TAB 87]|uniref:T9SS type B sorting domain-containing protein n=1 Tax=Flavobacterium sp. TAB 87 TaxID=1729581 RepID=UPI00076D9F0E|nr:T9SS type B sorting domain-containing protein [Flavobacterium sp. TAB 87]KVV13503.1 hypothetical protein AP058_02868 [Flavobacterium sp. TAB 87]
MKKPTILKAVLVVLFLIQSSISVAQNVVAYNSNTSSYLNTDPTLLGQSIAKHNLKSFVKSDKISKKIVAAVDINPVIKYAQLPYAGQVAVCPNNNKLLPKLFLCGGTDSRLIKTGIKDAKSIIWERFISGGSCITVSNSDCANESAAVTCWEKVAIGEDYLANSAGQFRVKIIDKTDTQYVYFFNVYQNTLIPTATTKSDIVKYDIACTINGKITVGGFGSGYEYSFSTTGSPGTWQNSNIFTTSTPGVYTAFIRIKEIVGSCEFKVLNLEIKSLDFSVATEIISPKCSGALGSIRVISSDVKQQYKYKITKPDFTDSSNLTEASEYIFTGLASGTYNVETTVVGSNCMVDSKTVIIAAAPNVIKASARISEELTACNDTGIILLENLSGGTKPYTYSVSIDGAAFVNNGTNKSIITSKSGIYTIRVTDANGCFIDTKVTVPVVDKPIYTVTKSEGSCSNPNGTIKVTIIDAKGYNIQTRINDENYITVDGYIEYPNRAPENYIIRVQYRKGDKGNYCIDTDIPISIGLTTALTASAGVAELSGCGPAGKELQGKVRITNAEGGVPIAGANPYLYSYDGMKTWTTSKEAYVDPGTHVFYVKDANCEIPLDKVILAEKPGAPTIKVDNPAFNCDGTATTTVTVTNDVNSQFKYEYYLDGVLNTNIPTNIFKNVSQGDHTITVSYNVVSVPTESVLLRETFGSGPDVSSPGINAAFCWERQVEATKCNGNKLFGNGEYTVTNSLKNNPYSGWHNPIDNTSKGKDPNGRYLAVDAGEAIPNNAVLYRKTIKDIIPNQPVKVTFVATNLLKIGNNQPDASLTVELQDANGVVLPGPPQSTGGIPKTNGWVEYTKTVNPGNNTTLDFVLRLELSQVNGIDFAVDDIVVTQMPKSCNTTANFPLVIDGSKAFAASITGYKNVQCNGEQNGEITLSAKNFDPVKGFQYQVDGGNWITVIPSPAKSPTTGSVTLQNLGSKVYDINIRYDDTGVSCNFPLKQEIKNPPVLTIKAEVTTKATCIFGATITAKAEGGTPGYAYELREANGTTLVQPFQDSGIFTNVAVGDYTVIAKDLNSCQSAVLAEVKVVAAVAPVAVFEPSNLCFDSTAEFKIKVTGGVGPYTYTTIYNGGTKSNPSVTFVGPILTYTVNNAGKYEFEITDSYGCKTNVLTETISAKLVTVTPVTTPLDCDVAPANEAVITGTITGGKAPFTVTLTSGSNLGTLVQPTAVTTTDERIFTYSTAVSGNYKFKITDANNCTTTSEATIAALNPITLGSTDINPKCNGDSNGSVTLIPGGGSGVYTYSKDGVLYDNTILYTGLKAGIEYTFYVKDGNGCTKSKKVTLVDPAVIVASANLPVQTCTKSTVVTASGSGGAGLVTTDYTYSFDGGEYKTTNTYTATKTATGYDLTYSVKDANGCTKDNKITIPAYNPPTGITFSTPAAISCKAGSTTTSVTLTPNNGTGVAPFTYKIVSGPGTATSNVSGLNDGTFTGLVSGDYTFEIKDANGCPKQASKTIAEGIKIKVSGVKTDEKCFNAKNGTATFTITEPSSLGNFTYVLSPTVPAGQILQTDNEVKVTGLGTGSYTLTVTDKTTGCSQTSNAVVVAAATQILINTVTATNVSCNKSESTIEVTATGGIKNYKYAYVVKGASEPLAGDFAITNTTINTGANQTSLDWDVYVMDQNGCIAGPFNKVITRDASPSTKTPAPAVLCFVAGPPMPLDVSTLFNLGTGTHKYTVNGTGITGTNYNIKASGTYTIIATDANNCSATATYIVKPEVTILATRVKDLDCISDGIISFVVSEGSKTYSSYEVQLNGTSPWTPVDSPFDVDEAGNYQIRVTDNAGCTAVSNIIEISPVTAPTFVSKKTNISCSGGSNGVITITNPTGLAPFTYSIKKGVSVVAFSTIANGITATALTAGTYDVVMKDSKNCTFSESITLSEPTQLVTTAKVTTPLSCGALNATQDAIITVTVPTTGTGPYKYSFNGGAFDTSNTYAIGVAGNVTVQVQDSNMCTLAAVITVPVAALNIPKLALITGTTLYCAPLTSTTSTVQVSTIAGTGVAPLSYTLVSGPSAGTTTATIGEFKDLIAGTYVFKVTDDNGCTDTQSYTVKSLVNINAVVASQIDVECNGDATGSAKITVSGFTGTYTATLISGTGTITPIGATTNTTIDVTGLVQGAYTLRVLDNVTGCSKDVTFTIAEPTAVTLTLKSNKNANCNTPLATVTVTAAGGTSPYSYAFINTTGNPAAGDYILDKNKTDLDPAIPTWYVWVKDANGCEKQLATPVTIVKDPAAAINVPAQQCFSGSPFTITLTGTGTGTLKYSVNGIPITGNTYSITAAGTYKLGVVDANNCDDFVNYTVDKQIFATSFLDKDITCVAPIDASITVNVTNGTGPYSYQIYNGLATVGSVVTGIATTTFTKTFATPGNYSFLVRDSKGCPVQTNPQLVTATVIPVITSVVQPINKMILCHDEETAEIVVTYDNTIGTAPFIINVKNDTTGKDYGEQTTGLKAGVYTITLTDARGCATTSTITIGEPTAIVIDAVADPITCNALGVSKGSVTINGVTGGTAPYDYFITGKFYINEALGETGGTVVFNVVDPGIYQVIVKDANGCTAIVADLKVASDVKDLDISVVLPPANCTTGGSATVAVGALSTNITGNGPFFFQIYTGQPQVYPTDGVWLPESSTGSKNATFTDLTPGVSYSFVVYDSITGCYFTSPSTTPIPSNSTLVAAVSGFNNVACKGDANGNVAFSVTSSYAVSTPITYEIFEATTKASTLITGIETVPANGNISFVNIGPLPIGAYYILIKEDLGGSNAGCSVATANFNITESLELLTVTASNTKKVNCNANSGVITASAQRGTGPYKYQYLLATATPPTGSSLLWIDSTTYKTSVTGNYIVYAKDAYGCIQSTPVTVDPEIAPAIAAITPASLCYTGTAIAVTVTADATTILPVTYSVNQGAIIGGYSNNNVFNLTPGTYTLNIKDGYGCIASAPFTVKEQLTLNPIAIKKVDCKTAAPNGGITVKADGGNTVLPATYTYSITAGPTINSTGAATGIFTDLADGNYTFEVSDGTCTATTTATIDALVPIVPTAAAGIPLCVGQATTVVINATGGTGTYTYQKGAAPTLPTETNNEFNQTAAEGEVTYYIKDANDCVETIKVTVTDPTPIATLTIVVDQMRCGGGNDPIEATITVTTSGGTNDFLYSFDNGGSYSSNNIRKTTAAGTYEIIVKDSNGCTTAMIPIVIDALDPPKITGFVPTQMTCPALTRDVKINYSNGIGTVTYTLVSGPSFPNNTGDTTGTYLGLLAGDYMFRVTDSKGCSTDEELYTVQKLPALQLVPNVVSNVKCKGGATGKATFTASSTTAPGAFTFAVATNPVGLPVISSKLGDVITLEDLAIGTYDVTIRDNTTTCEITKSVTITQPDLDLSINAVPSNVSCDKPISQITMSPLGGTPNYKYAIVPPGFSGAIIFSDVTTIDTSTLTNGIATPLGMTWAVEVHVQDANLCTAMIPITITKDDTPTVSVPTLASNQCTASGNYTFVATGTGVLPLSFSINGTDFFTSTGTTYTFTVPAPTGASQAYTVTVKDGNGCIATSATTITVYKPLQLAVTQVKDLTCAPAATTAGEFTFSATDGNNASYTFAVSINSAPFATITSPYTNSTIGTYVFQVTDANNCTVQSDPFEVTIPINPAIASTVISSPIECFGGTATLTVNVDLSKGVAPYTFVLSGATNNTGDSSGIYTGLVAGSYSVVVTDAKGCSSVAATQVINNPPLLTTTATQSINTTCSSETVITVVGAGGTPTGVLTGYYYNFNSIGYDSDNTFSVNDDGAIQTIIYTVKDANGCETAPKTITVDPLNKPTDLAFDATPILCSPIVDQTSTVTVTATNGVGALKFEIIEIDGVPLATPTVVNTTGAADPAIFAGLLAGDYTFKVTDANGCSYQELTTVDDGIKIAVSGEVVGVACKGEANGKITFKVSDFGATGFTATYTGPTGGTTTVVGTDTIELTNLIAGTYGIKVVDNTTLCEATVSIEVEEPVVLDVNYVTIKNANCNRGFEIKATAFDGTPGYTYAFVKAGDTKVYDVYDTAILDPAFTWTLWAKDAHGCEVSMPIVIVEDPMPTVTATTSQCASPYTITAVGASGVAPYEYCLDGNTWQLNNNILTVQTTGNHTVYVRDANKCVVTETVTILEPLQLLYELTTTPTCTDADGVVTLTASGGTLVASYEYSIDGAPYVSSNVFTNLAPNTYIFTVIDTGTNCTKEVEVIIENPNQIINFSLAKTDVICNGDSNGTITVNMDTATTTVNNNPVYTYDISPNVGTLVGNVFKNLPQGNYTITVTSGRGCSESKNETVLEPAPLVVVAPTVSEYGCATGNGTNDATISVPLPTGGSNVYTVYEFLRNGNPIPVQRGDNPIYRETDLLGGTYLINVYDDKGCLGTTTATINAFVGIDFATTENITVTKAITCIDTEDIQVNVVFTSGAAVPLDYTIEGTATNAIAYPTQTNTNGIFTNLTVGSYAITVANPITGCSIKAIHYVNEPNTFNIVASNVQNVICYGSATGSAVLTFVDNQTDPTDDAGPFEYTITGPNGSTPVQTTAGVSITIPNLPAGVYNVKAKLVNTPSCEVETNFTIAGPTAELEIFVTATPITCDPGDDGTISVTADGGWSGIYQYELVGPVSVPYSDQFYFENLIPGTYTVNVKDAGGCIDTETVILKNPDPIVVTASATATTLACNGSFDGEIVVALPTGGQGTNYAYILNYVSANPMFSSTPQSSPVFSGLGAGTYSVTVVDGLNCVSQPTANIVIGEPTKVEPTLSLETGVTCLTQATLTLSATGGKGPYEYSEDQNFVIVSGSFVSEVTFSVGLGDHQYYVRDANNCVSFISNNVTINALTPLDLNLDLSNADVKCTGSASGVIDASAVGGLGNYLYTLLDASKVAIRPTQSTGYFDLLLAGTYIVRVDSGDCQFDSGVVTIAEPLLALTVTPLITNVTCNSNKDGKITIDASGGTGAISYAISPNLNQFFEGNSATGHVFDNLRAGNYEVLVTDENGCFVSLKNITITEPDDLIATIIPNSIREEVCQGDNDGAFSIDIEGGTAPYQISLDNFKGVYTTVTTLPYDFTGLSGGKHTVYVKDALNCTTEVEIEFEAAVILNPKAVVTYDCVNNASANVVTITIDDSNDPADVDYDLDGAGVFQPSGIFTNVAPGKHFVIARHSNGCEKRTIEFEVIAVAPLTLTLSDGQLNQIVATATGGSGEYEYSFNSESFTSSSNYVYYKSDVYTVTVRDKNGCTATASRQFDYVDVCIPNYFTPNGDGNQDTWGPGCSINYTDLVYTIFDRYGREIAKYRFGQKWDGTYKGAALPTGDYWYVVKLNNPKDDREFVGHFTLYR